MQKTRAFKVQLFWEGHKNVRNRPNGLENYLVNVQTMRTIAQIFLAFSENLNFMLWNFFDIYLFPMIIAKYVYYVTFRGFPLLIRYP